MRVISHFLMLIAFTSILFAQPTTISYQGILTDDEGNPLTETKNIRFDIYQTATLGSSIWNETHSNVVVDGGLFNVELGSVSAFGSLSFAQELWLEITVDGTALTPRIAFNASSYALESPNYGMNNFNGSVYLYDLKTGVKLTPNNSEANVDLVIQPKGEGGILAQKPDGAIAGGLNRGKYAIDLQLSRMSPSMVASGDYSVISGGENNIADKLGATVSGGYTNGANGNFATVSGGYLNYAGGNYSVISGGIYNAANGDQSVVLGGADNAANGYLSSITGGFFNKANGNYTSIIGGITNTGNGNYSLVGGLHNTAQSYAETVLGLYASVGSGTSNSYVATDRLFVVGNGTGTSARSNALTILKNGNTSISGSLQLGIVTHSANGDMSGITNASVIKYTYNGAVTNLPTASGYAGKTLYILNASGSTRTISGESVMNSKAIQLISDGTNWFPVIL